MQTQEFLGQVQNKAGLATLGEAMRATRATLYDPDDIVPKRFSQRCDIARRRHVDTALFGV